MEFLSKEVDGALTAQKIRGETLNHPNYMFHTAGHPAGRWPGWGECGGTSFFLILCECYSYR